VSSLIRGLSIAALLAASLAAAGCGSSSDDDAPTKAQFIKQADAICKKAHDRFGKAFQQDFGSNPQPSQAQLNKFAESTLAPGVQGEIDDIRDLESPSADQDQVDAILDAEQKGVDKIKANPAILSPSVKEDPLSKGQHLAKDYGMKECST
jgi:hypothetical protein